MKTRSTAMMVLGASFVLAAAMCACGGQGDGNDNGQPADVAGEDTAEPLDTALPEDPGNPGDVAVDTGNDLGGQDVGGDDLTDTASGDEGTDIEPGDTVDGPDFGPLDPTWTMEACPTGAGENTMLPLVTEFDEGGDMNANGWDIIHPQEIAGGMWDLASSTGVFGTNTGRYAVFMGEEGVVSRTGLVSGCLDTTLCVGGSVTMQWRMQYLHADPTQEVGLDLVANIGPDLDHGYFIWSKNHVTEDIPYGLFSVELPEALVGTNGIRFALLLTFADGSAAATESWSIDHFVVSCGKANANTKTIVYDCPNPDESCVLATAVKRDGETSAGEPATVAMTDGTRSMVVLCDRDPDGTAMTWQTFGYPMISMDNAPMESPAFAMPAASIGQGNSCETLPVMVALTCGTPAETETGHFFCAYEFAPDIGLSGSQPFEIGLVTRDEYDKDGVAPLHEPLESLIPLHLTVNAAE